MKVKIVCLKNRTRYQLVKYNPLINTVHEVIDLIIVSGDTYYVIHNPIENSHAPWSKILLLKTEVEVVES